MNLMLPFNLDPSSIVVPADGPYNTIEKCLEYGQEHPGKIRIGNGETVILEIYQQWR